MAVTETSSYVSIPKRALDFITSNDHLNDQELLTDIQFSLACLSSLEEFDIYRSFQNEGTELLRLVVSDINEERKASEFQTKGIYKSIIRFDTDILKERFVSAQDCFRASREAATHAFNNESLSIKDRIMACKLRMAARILEFGFEDPKTSIIDCLAYLEDLHGLSAIQEMFSVYLKRGLKSVLKKAERLENIKSVLFINQDLYDFASKYDELSNISTWPVISLIDRTFHPIEDASEILTQTNAPSAPFVPPDPPTLLDLTLDVSKMQPLSRIAPPNPTIHVSEAQTKRSKLQNSRPLSRIIQLHDLIRLIKSILTF